jgi:hypothetical protein
MHTMFDLFSEICFSTILNFRKVIFFIMKPTCTFSCVLVVIDEQLLVGIRNTRRNYGTKTLVTNKCTKRVLPSIVTHSNMFRPCWVIFTENFSLPLYRGCTLQLSENVLLTVYCVVFGGVNSLPCRPGPQRVHASENNAVHSQQHIFAQL